MASTTGYAAMGSVQAGRNTRQIDTRSDTVTKPSAAMRVVMSQADVGDDVYDEDPTAIALEKTVASMLGKQASMFVPTGTQSNLLALLSHCQRGEEFIAGHDYHAFIEEAAGAAVLGGISPFHIPTEADGGMDPQKVKAAIKDDDFHYAISKLVCLENTVHGKIQTIARVEEVTQVARDHGLSTHLDGARLMNAAVGLGVAPAQIVKTVDSVSLCLSKGLGCPVGSVLSGTEEFISKAKRYRKMLGGGMRQIGVLAACGLYALDNNVDRLAQDHLHARTLAEALNDIDGITVDLDEVQTNMLFIEPREGSHEALRLHLQEHDIIIGGQVPRVRLVMHLDILPEDIERMISAFQSFYK